MLGVAHFPSCVEPVIVMDDLLREFLDETGEHLDTVDLQLVQLERDPGAEEKFRSIFRLVHTIKGTCGFLGLPRIEALAHAVETLLDRLRRRPGVTGEAVVLLLASTDRMREIIAEVHRIGTEPVGSDRELVRELERAGREAPPSREGDARSPVARAANLRPEQGASGQPTVRVALQTLDRLSACVSELVLTRNRLVEFSAAAGQEDGRLAGAVRRLSQVTAALQEGVVSARMQPVGEAWSRLPRLLRDLAAEFGKDIDLVLSGDGIELDRQVLDAVRDPLMHLVRNSAAHGIESPADRRALGKPERGTIRLEALRDERGVTIQLTDDGRGLDIEAIRRRARDQGLEAGLSSAPLSEAQVIDLIFRPGFTTSETADALSGRGVGMDVVRTNVELVGGAVEVRSEPGRGMAVTLKLPRTLAVLPALILSIAGQRFVLPQAFVHGLVPVGPDTATALERARAGCLIRRPQGLVPVIDTAAVMVIPGAGGAECGLVVLLQIGGASFGILVDAVLDIDEVVSKPITSRLAQTGLFSGTTLLGDGSVALVIDPKGLARRSGIDLGATIRARLADQPEPSCLTELKGSAKRDDAPIRASRPELLLVDGDPFGREMLRAHLESLGYNVRPAADADAGLALLLRQRFDAVVTDLSLPGRPGLDLVDALRRHPPTAAIPVVLVSYSQPGHKALRRAKSLGVAHVVPKHDRFGFTSALADLLRREAIAA